MALSFSSIIPALRKVHSDGFSYLNVNARAFEGARLRYEHGAGDLLTLLEAQRVLYESRDQFIQYRLARLEALVALCKALGGGWRASAAPAESARGHGEQHAAS